MGPGAISGGGVVPGEAETVEAWRQETALRLGYTPKQALLLARSTTDLHDVERLLKAGCRKDLAARIAWSAP